MDGLHLRSDGPNLDGFRQRRRCHRHCEMPHLQESCLN
jgi:hypothetical protein